MGKAELFFPRYLTMTKAGQYASRKPATVRKWLQMGLPKIVTPTGAVLIDREQLDQFLSRHEQVEVVAK